MKKNIKYIVAAVAGLWLTGCTDDLDRLPVSSLSPETYFNTEEEIDYALEVMNEVVPKLRRYTRK